MKFRHTFTLLDLSINCTICLYLLNLVIALNRCPEKGILNPYSGRCIILHHVEATQPEAREVCKKAGGDLVKILNEASNHFIWQQANRLSKWKMFWIGLTRKTNLSYYTWGDEIEEATYTAWRQGEPNSKVNLCVSMNYHTSEGWTDDHCQRLKNFFICETSAECAEGFFGGGCKVMCHCEGGNRNCRQGKCTQGCDQKFIGTFCQYKAFPPTEDPKMIWLQDGNPHTCNTGITPFVVLPTFKTPVTFMRVTFQEKDLLKTTSFHLSHVEKGVETSMTCSKRGTRGVDLARKVYDIPCFTSKVVHSITFGGEGAGKLCELLISPGRNIAPFHIGLGSLGAVDNNIQYQKVVDGQIVKDNSSLKACDLISGSMWSLYLKPPNEINMIILYSTGGGSKLEMDVVKQYSKITIERDAPYYDFFIEALYAKQVDVKEIRLKQSSSSFHLCELELLGDIYCCRSTMSDGCLGPKGSSPQCSKNEFTACKNGQRGDFCEKECPQGYYGPDCALECIAECKGGQCEPTYGACLKCHAGYWGKNCRKPCNVGLYGPRCGMKCSPFCKKNTTGKDGRSCNHVTGKCVNGCLAGRVGERCQYDKCSKHCKGGSKLCDRRLGTCLFGCEPGYSGVYCFRECPAGTYGLGCKQSCPANCPNKQCDKVNGRCVKTCPLGTYQTPQCDKRCAQGTYGLGCKEKCSTHCKAGQCLRTNGTCIGGCLPGYVAPLCKKPCPKLSFGQDCDQTCSQRCDGVCYHITGTCDSCMSGTYGPYCQHDCPSGKFGPDCLQSCPDECSTSGCDVKTGDCTLCPPGKTGKYCYEDCPNGTYGQGCKKFCSQYCINQSCDPVDASCRYGCMGKWSPPLCTGCLAGWFGSDCKRTCGLFCKECDKVTGKCDACVHGRTGDSCRDREISSENYMRAGILSAALFALLITVSYCVGSTVQQKQRARMLNREEPGRGEDDVSGDSTSDLETPNSDSLSGSGGSSSTGVDSTVSSDTKSPKGIDLGNVD